MYTVAALGKWGQKLLGFAIDQPSLNKESIAFFTLAAYSAVGSDGSLQ